MLQPMNLTKILQTIALLLVIIVLALVVYLLLQKTPLTVQVPFGATTSEEATSTPNTNTAASEGTTDNAAITVPHEGFVIDIQSLPAAQQSALKALGYSDTITISPAAVTCAEEKIGTARVLEIKNGAAPSLVESTKLAGCL